MISLQSWGFTQLLKLAHKYTPETKQEKKQRLLAQAEKKGCWQMEWLHKRPHILWVGVNNVTTWWNEYKRAGSDCTQCGSHPAGHLPALYVPADGVPYCIIKGKSRLGHLVYRKICTTVTFMQVNWGDKGALARLVEAIWTNHNDRYDEIHCHWGGKVSDSHCHAGRGQG